MTRPAKAANMFFARSFGNGGTVCQTKRGREAAGKTHWNQRAAPVCTDAAL